MKRTVFLLLVSTYLPTFTIAQFKQDLGLNGSWRKFNSSPKQISLSVEYSILFNKFAAGMAIGAERWYNKPLMIQSSHVSMEPSFTGKIEPWLGFRSSLFQSPIFLSVEVGGRLYFLNQVKDSISLETEGDPTLIKQSRNQILSYSTYSNANWPPVLGQYSYVTAMPYALLTRVNLGYSFERIKVSAFIMPYWIRMRYVNAANANLEGEAFLFFYDIGLGVNYTLPSRKKEQ